MGRVWPGKSGDEGLCQHLIRYLLESNDAAALIFIRVWDRLESPVINLAQRGRVEPEGASTHADIQEAPGQALAEWKVRLRAPLAGARSRRKTARYISIRQASQAARGSVLRRRLADDAGDPSLLDGLPAVVTPSSQLSRADPPIRLEIRMEVEHPAGRDPVHPAAEIPSLEAYKMDNITPGADNVVRWLVLLAAVWALFRTYFGWLGARAWEPSDKQAGFLLTTAADNQFLLGVILAVISPLPKRRSPTRERS